MKITPFLEYILYDIFAEQQPLSVRAMMGAYILYYEGKPFALVKDEKLYFKGDKQVMDWYITRKSKQFTYIKEGKDAYLYYFLVPSETYEDRDLREEWLEVALGAAKVLKRDN